MIEVADSHMIENDSRTEAEIRLAKAAIPITIIVTYHARPLVINHRMVAMVTMTATMVTMVVMYSYHGCPAKTALDESKFLQGVFLFTFSL